MKWAAIESGKREKMKDRKKKNSFILEKCTRTIFVFNKCFAIIIKITLEFLAISSFEIKWRREKKATWKIIVTEKRAKPFHDMMFRIHGNK